MRHSWRTRPGPVRGIADRLRASAGAAHLRYRDRRQAARVRRATVGSNVGIVIDLSEGGMRVRSRRRQYGAVDIELTTRTDVIKVKAKVVWTRKIAFRRHEIGFQFLDMTPETSAKVAALATELRGD